jgi:hypothetical protein
MMSGLDEEDIPLEVPDSPNAVASSSLGLIDLVAKDFEKVWYYNKLVPVDQAYKQAVRAVEVGKGNWGRTNVTLLDEATSKFNLSCSTCNRVFAFRNPPNFWQSHSVGCTHDGTAGQSLVQGPGAFHSSANMCFKSTQPPLDSITAAF